MNINYSFKNAEVNKRERCFLYSSVINNPIELLKRYKKVASVIMQDFVSDTEDEYLATVLNTHA